MSLSPSHPWFIAELMAFPIASQSAFDNKITRLRRPSAGSLDPGETSKLAADLEPHLRLRTHGTSLEVLRQLRDGSWFRSEEREVPITELLARVATAHLDLHGDRVVLGRSPFVIDDRPMYEPPPPTHSELVARWRWLTLTLPQDLMTTALAARRGHVTPVCGGVLLSTPGLREVLAAPCAETHLHVGAGVPFDLVWTGLVSDPPLPVGFESTRGPLTPFGETGAMLRMIVVAALARMMFDEYLESPTTSFFDAAHRTRLGARFASFPSVGGAYSHLALTSLMLDGLRSGPRVLPPDGYLRVLLAQLAGGRTVRCEDPLNRVARHDPLARTSVDVRQDVLPEARWTHRALRHLLGPGRRDESFALAFWQYQRVRCLVYRYLIEEPGTAGLDWFTRSYGRISPLRRALENGLYASALEVQSADLHLGALEGRTSPQTRWDLVRDQVRDMAQQAAAFAPRTGSTRPQVGLVLHFIKSWHRKDASIGADVLHASPRSHAFGTRHGPWYHKAWLGASAIATALRHHPDLLLVLRGIDVANVELAQPTWVLIPLFRHVHEAARDAAAAMRRVRPEWSIEPLRTTLHVGEDYRRLVEGIRRMHEPLEFGLLGLGDRVGHGIALAENPQRSAGHTILQPAEERLDDLLWELDRYQRGDLPAEAGRLEMVRTQVSHLARDIYEWSLSSVDHFIASRRLRHDPEALRLVGFPFSRVVGPSEKETDRHLLWRHLTDEGVFARGQRPVPVVQDAGEVTMLRAAQRWLRAEYAQREITIEANPSSNLLIGDFASLGDHPAFRLSPLGESPAVGDSAVLLSVNTDNPVTFATCLADEFAYIHHALLHLGVSSQDALAWIHRAREAGWRSRFTLAASADADILRQVANPPRV